MSTDSLVPQAMPVWQYVYSAERFAKLRAISGRDDKDWQIKADELAFLLAETGRRYVADHPTREFLPDLRQLYNAFAYLVQLPLSLLPEHRHVCLLVFGNRNSKYLSVVPYVQKDGLLALLRLTLPVADVRCQVVLDGDEFDYRETADGPALTWAPGKERHLVELMARGQLKPDAIQALWCRIRFTDGRAPAIGVLLQERLQEKLQSNRNASGRGGGPWQSHPMAMLEKTVLRHTVAEVLFQSGESWAGALQAIAEQSDTVEGEVLPDPLDSLDSLIR